MSHVDLMRSFFDQAEDLFILYDKDLRVIAINKAVTQLFKRKEEDILGKDIAEISPDVMGSGRYDLYRERVIGSGKPLLFDNLFTFPCLGNVWLRLKVFKVGDGLGMIGTNITEFKDTQRQLELTLERFNQAQKTAHLGLWEVDLSTGKNMWSDEAFRIYDLEPQSVEPTYELFLKYLHPEDQEMGRSVTENARQNLMPFSFTHRIITAKGHVKNLLAVARYEFDKKLKKPTGLYGICLDITEVTEKEKKLEAVNKELETFIYKLSHDLRSPIASVTGLAKIAQLETSDATAKKYFELINDLMEKQDGILQTLVKAMILKDRNYSVQDVDLNELINEILQSIQNIPGFKETTIKTNCAVAGTVKLDYQSTYSLLQNLVVNGIKYRKRNIEQSIVEVRIDRDGQNRIRIEISDNGMGIREDIKDKVFDMFYRGSNYSTGSGLGLYLVKNAVEKMGGTISLESRENVGSTFKISLPIMNVEAGA